ncbi:AMP-binding domain-containing protein [Aphelenchoides besseyi]|nr:AMP-binding domain-containing protein [Aphelenchoides besseyi]KAI6207927.1 AMP-binding domain-containing protein [Aphelenchoides besseyi]
MPLRIRPDSVFCLEFTHEKQDDFIPYSCVIPELLYRKSKLNKTAFVFDSEKLSFSFSGLITEMESLAAGFLAVGLQPNDRLLIAGYNNHSVLIAVLAASRAGIVFSLVSPNFSSSDELKHLCLVGGFKGVLLFAANGSSDFSFNILSEISPELKGSQRGKLNSPALPDLRIVILGDEEHKHGGCWTLSEVFGKVRHNHQRDEVCTKPRLEKLPNFKQWNPNRIAAIGWTLGSTGPQKACALTHYQLINCCRIVANTIGIKQDTVLALALPIYRLPVFCLSALTPFFFESCTIVSEPSPVPRFLFASINRYSCTHLISNALAMRLLIKMGMMQKTKLPTVQTAILLGDRVSAELLMSIERVMPLAKHIAVGMLLTEIGIPILSDRSTNLLRSAGKTLENFAIDVIPVDKLHGVNGQRVGELRVWALEKTKFLGYGPNFDTPTDFVETGDIASISRDGNVEIITNKADLCYDRVDKLVKHWEIERLLATCESIKGVQVLQQCHGAPIIAVVVPKKKEVIPQFIKTDLNALCRNNQMIQPDKIAIVDDFPRVNTRIQKYKLREMLRAKSLILY